MAQGYSPSSNRGPSDQMKHRWPVWQCPRSTLRQSEEDALIKEYRSQADGWDQQGVIKQSGGANSDDYGTGVELPFPCRKGATRLGTDEYSLPPATDGCGQCFC